MKPPRTPREPQEESPSTREALQGAGILPLERPLPPIGERIAKRIIDAGLRLKRPMRALELVRQAGATPSSDTLLALADAEAAFREHATIYDDWVPSLLHEAQLLLGAPK